MINLLPPQTKSAIRAGRHNVRLRRYCSLLIFALLCGLAIGSGGWWLSQQQVASAEARLAEAQAATAPYQQVASQATAFNNDLTRAKTILAGDLQFSLLLTRLGSLTPRGVILSNFSLGAATIATPLTINARASSSQQAVEFKNQLATSGIFENVSLSTISTANDNRQDPLNNRYPVAITLTAQFNKNLITNPGALQ